MTETPKTTPGPVFIAWSGKKQVGKDTSTEIAKRILEENGKRVGVTAFAESLKHIAISAVGIPEHLVYGSNEDKEQITHIFWDTFPLEVRLKYYRRRDPHDGRPEPRMGPMTVREVLQVMGTDIFRVMFEDEIWAKSPFRRDWDDYDVVFITDCRFPNEKAITERYGGTVIRIERDTGFEDDHASETALDGESFSRIYKNDGSLEDLENFVRTTLTDLGLL